MPQDLLYTAGKVISAGVLIFDEAQNILLVKPTYRDSWTTVGGSAEKFESPRETAFREVKEEIGIAPSLMRLLAVHYIKVDQHGVAIQAFENLAFQFLAQPLRPAEVADIRLQKDEVSACQFVPIDDLPKFARAPFLEAITLAIKAFSEGRTLYTENFKETVL